MPGPAAPAPHDGQALYSDSRLPHQQPPVQPQQPGVPQAPGQYFADSDATGLLPPQQGVPAQAFEGGLPAQTYAGVQSPPNAPLSASDATQYIPPVTDGPPPGHMPPAGAADATQMLPPQTGQVQDPEATTSLRSPLPPETRGGTGVGPYGMSQGGNAQREQQRQTPAEFDSLFRADPSPGAGGGAGSTQSLPLFDHAAARQRSNGVGGIGAPGGPAAPGGPQQGRGGPGEPMGQGGRAARRNAERGVASRLSPVVLIGIGVVLVAALGMAAGAALTGGDGGGEKDKGDASAGKAEEKKAPAGPDPVKAQAQELDKLLADSNNSRTSVIRSVESIKSCKNLGRAASDLRAAAGQRNGLVTRLGQLETDKIPGNTKLTAALTRAWKSSAAADSHYATWADQTARKKGCKKGKARVTAHTGAGARSSGEATTAKREAAGVWNPTAQKYGLKARQYGQL
jgi:hypothetical protein